MPHSDAINSLAQLCATLPRGNHEGASAARDIVVVGGVAKFLDRTQG